MRIETYEQEQMFWMNHLAKLNIKLVNDLTKGKCTKETKRRIKHAELELDVLLND
jgi:hypothetical protein